MDEVADDTPATPIGGLLRVSCAERVRRQVCVRRSMAVQSTFRTTTGVIDDFLALCILYLNEASSTRYRVKLHTCAIDPNTKRSILRALRHCVDKGGRGSRRSGATCRGV